MENKERFRRVFVIVIDSLGVGGAVDAAEFGDAGADTLGHIASHVKGFSLPNLQKLGIANLHPLEKIAPVEHPMGYYTKLNEISRGKDTMTGHWEMMGLKTEKPFITRVSSGIDLGA